MYHIELYNLVLTYIIYPFHLLSLQFIEPFVFSSSCTTLFNVSSHSSSFKTPCLFHVILLLIIFHPCLPLLGNIFCLSVFKYSFSFSLKVKVKITGFVTYNLSFFTIFAVLFFVLSIRFSEMFKWVISKE